MEKIKKAYKGGNVKFCDSDTEETLFTVNTLNDINLNQYEIFGYGYENNLFWIAI